MPVFINQYTVKNSNISLKNAAGKNGNIWMLLPLFGTVVFVCLYITATLFYPGGSQVDETSKGFSWANNYWCNLLNEKAMNGQLNPARPIAITAMFILCCTLANFWWIFPQQVGFKRDIRFTIQISGLLAMIVGMLLFTNLHDTVVNAASLCGLIATVGTFAGLRKLNWKKLFWLGIFNLLLVALNNILYYGNGLKLYLPVVQKITFFFFLLWICLINIKLFNKNKYETV